MQVKNKMFQPGRILYEVILGAFKASGTSFEQWCRDNDVSAVAARSALKGFSTGTQGQAIIEKLVEGAGREVVTVAYRLRIERHAAEVAA
mgnify:CR=1 FL=1|tara:strand:- start:93 stop:362 length:270 start_codon:yes stop_codon:yes gene_type:complete